MIWIRRLGAILVLYSVSALGAISIVQPVIAQFDGGPAVAPSYGFGSGESVFLSFDLAGFKPEGDEDLKIDLSWNCQVFDGAGVAMTAVQTGEVKVGLAPEDKKWRPRVRVELALPQAVLLGAAEIRIVAADRVGATNAVLKVPFRTRGLDLTGVDTVRPLRFRFLRSEDAVEPLSIPAYQKGDSLWARFEIAGYRLGEGNLFQVSYGLEVFRANGESLFRQEEAASENGKTIYPRRYLFGALSLQLKDLATGEYTIVLRIRDGVGNQQSETKHPFRVE